MIACEVDSPIVQVQRTSGRRRTKIVKWEQK